MLTKLTKELNNTLPRGQVLTNIEERYAYSFDASERQSAHSNIADAVVFVQNTDEVLEVDRLRSHSVSEVIPGFERIKIM